MSTLKIFMKENSKKGFFEELNKIQERIAVSELQETKKEKSVNENEKNLKEQ